MMKRQHPVLSLLCLVFLLFSCNACSNSKGSLSSQSQTNCTSVPAANHQNLIQNSSVEEASMTLPTNWYTNAWGKNLAQFTYLNSGHTGKKSLKTEITQYETGDAKWEFSLLKLSPGEYQYSDWYIANIETRVLVYFVYANGQTSFSELRKADPTKNWQKYIDQFTVQDGTQSVIVFHLISAVGYLITDDFSITGYSPTGFVTPLVTLTFDNGFED